MSFWDNNIHMMAATHHPALTTVPKRSSTSNSSGNHAGSDLESSPPPSLNGLTIEAYVIRAWPLAFHYGTQTG